MKKLLYLIPILLLSLILTSCINTNSIKKDIHDYHMEYNDECHYDICDCGKIINEEKHIYGDVILTSKEPTCEDEGIQEQTCTICGYKQQTVIPALGHKPITINGTPASCDNTGISDCLVCETCGKTLQAQEVLSKLNHNFGEWEEDMPATCTNKGKEKRECIHCHLEEYRDIPMKEHNYIQGDSDDSTCTHQGHTSDTHCKDCGYVLTPSETLPLLEHEYEYSKTINAPTYLIEGLDEYKCKNCNSTKTIKTNRLEYTKSMFESSVSTFDNMEANYTLIDTTKNINVTVTIINKDSIKFVKIINNIINQEDEYYLSNNVVVEKIPQGYKHKLYDSNEDLYSIYYNYLNNSFKNAPGTNKLVFDPVLDSYTVSGDLLDYNSNIQNDSSATVTIDSKGKALAYSFESANVKIEATINYSPSSINVPTTHYHTFYYYEECVVCGETATKYEAYKDNFIITYYVFDNGSIQYEFEMDNDIDQVPTFTEPTMYKSTDYDLTRFTQSYTVGDITKTFYIYIIKGTTFSEYDSDNLESELGTMRVGETDNAILPDGTRIHIQYIMDKDLYIKVYKEGYSPSNLIYEGKVFNIKGVKNDFYLYFQNKSDGKLYKLHYDWNIEIREAS